MNEIDILDQEINHYLPHLSAKQKKVVLSIVKTFAADQQDWWDKTGGEQQKIIDKSLLEMKAGKLTSYDPAKLR